jgi:hypothetical protein
MANACQPGSITLAAHIRQTISAGHRQGRRPDEIRAAEFGSYTSSGAGIAGAGLQG